MSNATKDFIGFRAQLYTEAQNEFEFARSEEVRMNMGYFKPQRGEKILEIGAGSGLYSKALSDRLGAHGELVVSDPSDDQLENIRSFKRSNIQIVKAGAEWLHVHPTLCDLNNYFDAIWSLGAFHHCNDKSQGFRNFAKLLKKGGRVFICDVLSGSALADYFDVDVARHSITGHEVSFLTKGFFGSLCDLYGFSEPKFHDLDYCWHFSTEKDLGLFMYKLHGMSKTTPAECLEMVGQFMKIERKANSYVLHVPLTIFETYKIQN